MNKIKDVLYNISDLLIAFLVMIIVIFSFYYNISVFFVNIFGESIEKNIDNMAKKSVEKIIDNNFQQKNKETDPQIKKEISKVDLPTKEKEDTPKEKIEQIEKENTKKKETDNNPSKEIAVTNNELNSDKKSKEIDDFAKKIEESKKIEKEKTKDEEKEENKVKEEANNQQKDDKPKYVKVTIPPSTSASKAIDILYAHSLIKSKQNAMRYMINNRLDSRVRAGTFTISTANSDEQVINLITSR